MFDRSTRGDTEGDYRHHWLLHDLPQAWCELNQHRYLGIAKSLELMRSTDEQAYNTLKRALNPRAESSDIEAAVQAIAGSR
jgi:hypothetical protein